MNESYKSGRLSLAATAAMGTGVMIGASALLMVFSMIINERLVVRTFGTYTLQCGPIDHNSLSFVDHPDFWLRALLPGSEARRRMKQSDV